MMMMMMIMMMMISCVSNKCLHVILKITLVSLELGLMKGL